MASGSRISTKKIQIDKANSMVVAVVGVSAFLVAFSLVSIKSLLARRSYQAKVISAQEKARDTLTGNINAVNDLKIRYNEFTSRTENIIKGSSVGSGPRDGDNARIILDALPSKYDYPALASSLEKILLDKGYKIDSISGVDQEVTQNGANAAAVQQAVDMPFTVAAVGSYKGMVDLLVTFRKSIRPLYIQKLSFDAGGEVDSVKLSIEGKTYYQPERTLNITEEVVQ